jgi:hypothetical protein
MDIRHERFIENKKIVKIYIVHFVFDFVVIVCSVSFIVRVVLCAVFCLSVVCYFV